MPEAPNAAAYPEAKPIVPAGSTVEPQLRYDTLTRQGARYTLDGHVQLRYGGRLVEADHIDYDGETGELNAAGHLRLSGGPNDESLTASHGTLNTKAETGRFYDVSGSVGLKHTAGRQAVYTNGNPFLFTGKVVVKTGPESYDIYGGTVTSCQLPHPDWLFSAGHFRVNGARAEARNSTFRLFNVPLLFLPYVTHPVESGERQAGVLIPVLGQSSSKGFVLGETIYMPFNRSTDLTVGRSIFHDAGTRSWRRSGTAGWATILPRRTTRGCWTGRTVRWARRARTRVAKTFRRAGGTIFRRATAWRRRSNT